MADNKLERTAAQKHGDRMGYCLVRKRRRGNEEAGGLASSRWLASTAGSLRDVLGDTWKGSEAYTTPRGSVLGATPCAPMSSSPRQVDMSEALSPTESPATVTFEQLSTLFVPGTVVVQDCHITGQKRAYCLVGALPADHQVSSREYHEGFLRFRHVEYLDMMPRKSDSPAGSSSHYLSGDCRISKTSASLLFQVEKFNGVRSIQNLPIYPIQYHPDGKLERGLIARGKKWAGLCGRMQLVKYTGRVWRMTFKFYPVPTIPVVDELSQVEEANVFLDNEAFFIMNPHAWVFLGGNINAKEHMDTQDEECNDAIDKGLPESLLLLAPTVVHGYSLESRQWLIYDVNGTFKEVSIKNSEAAVASRLQRPTSLSKVIETHLRINAISQHVRGEDGQGLFLNLYGFTASTKAEDIARLYIDAGGVRRPQHTFYASQLSAGSSDLESFRKVINSTNAVVTVHQDKRRLFILFDWFVSGNFRATLPEQVMSALRGNDRKCVVLFVSAERLAMAQEQELQSASNFSLHRVGFYEWLTIQWWITTYYWIVDRIQCMLG